MLSLLWEHVCHVEGFAALYQTAVGQILEIRGNDWSRTIILETPLGDIINLNYQPDAIGTTPYVGGVYAITYQMDGDTPRVVEVRKPAPGQYRAEFERGLVSQETSEFQRGISIEGSYTTTYPPRPRRSLGPLPPSRGEYAPTKSVTQGVRPNGIAFIATMLLLSSIPALTLGIIFSAFFSTGFYAFVFGSFGLVVLFLSWGIYTYRAWARIGVLIIGVLFCISMIGLVIGLPIIWYLEQRHIKRMFVF